MEEIEHRSALALGVATATTTPLHFGNPRGSSSGLGATGMAMTFIPFAALMTSLLVLSNTSAARAATLQWDLASDFRTSPHQANPNPDSYGNNDVWHFLESPSLDRNPGTYQRLSEFIPNAFNISGLEQWQNPVNWFPNDRLPAVGINATEGTQDLGSFLWPKGEIRFHPFLNQMAIAGWRSPLKGAVDITGSFGDMDPNGGNGVHWFVDHGNISLAEGDIDGNSEAFSVLDVPVMPGDFLYFIVSSNGEDFFYDSTSVAVHISGIPLPAAAPLIASGLAILGLVGWRRRRPG